MWKHQRQKKFYNPIERDHLYLLAPSSTVVVGKNKCLAKGGQKQARKKVVDSFSNKDWYDKQAQTMFNIRNI